MTRSSGGAEIGRRISARRIQRGLSQGTVSRRAGMDPSYLSRIETGRISPTLRTAMKIAEALGCTLDDLVAPFATQEPGSTCPVSSSGHCLMDQVTATRSHPAGSGHKVTPREVRLLRQFSELIESAEPGMLGALEALLRELQRGSGTQGESRR